MPRKAAKSSASKPKQSAGPKATRPHAPGYGLSKDAKGLLSWDWAANHLARARNYFITTVTPEGAPHVMVVWGLWFDNAFVFSTGRRSRKGRNLANNPRCVICPENAEEAVIVEGIADEITDKPTLKKIYAAYNDKYSFDPGGMAEPFFRVRPRRVFGLIEKSFTTSATRWLFPTS